MAIDWPNTRIILTGGAGFLGRCVKSRLLARGATDANIVVPRRRDCDLTSERDVARLYRDAFGARKTDMVIHLAAEVGGIGANRKQFDFKDYVTTPEVYVSKLAMYLPYCVAYINGSYWDERFPRVLDDSTLRRMYANGTLPEVLGDVACDIDGGIESDLRSLKEGLPFDGIMRGFPIGVADTAHNSDESAGSDDSSERQ